MYGAWERSCGCNAPVADRALAGGAGDVGAGRAVAGAGGADAVGGVAVGGAPGAGGEGAPRGWRLNASILALRSSTRGHNALTVVARPSSPRLSPAPRPSFSASRCPPPPSG